MKHAIVTVVVVSCVAASLALVVRPSCPPGMEMRCTDESGCVCEEASISADDRRHVNSVDCRDGEACTKDANIRTFHVPLGDRGCRSDEDCQDDDACTTKACVNSKCLHSPVDCRDDDECTTDVCANGVCFHRRIPCPAEDEYVSVCEAKACEDAKALIMDAFFAEERGIRHVNVSDYLARLSRYVDSMVERLQCHVDTTLENIRGGAAGPTDLVVASFLMALSMAIISQLILVTTLLDFLCGQVGSVSDLPVFPSSLVWVLAVTICACIAVYLSSRVVDGWHDISRVERTSVCCLLGWWVLLMTFPSLCAVFCVFAFVLYAYVQYRGDEDRLPTFHHMFFKTPFYYYLANILLSRGINSFCIGLVGVGAFYVSTLLLKRAVAASADPPEGDPAPHRATDEAFGALVAATWGVAIGVGSTNYVAAAVFATLSLLAIPDGLLAISDVWAYCRAAVVAVDRGVDPPPCADSDCDGGGTDVASFPVVGEKKKKKQKQ